MGQQNRWDILQRFLTNKATPTASLGYDLLQGRTTLGQPLTLKNEVLPKLIPLAAQDAYSLYQDKGNIPLGVAGYVASGLGAGVQTYGPRQIVKGVRAQGKALPQTLLDAAKKAGLQKEMQAALTPEVKQEIKVYTMRQAAYGALRQQKGHLTPVDRFVSDVNLLVKNGVATAAQAKEATDWAKTAKPSELQKTHNALSRRYFSFSNLSHIVTVLADRGQKVKLPAGG
jgi:hypothetical protein